MNATSARTPDDLKAMRDTILARIVSMLERDDRVVAAWLTGSFGRGEDDAWSDLDLHIAIEDDHLAAWWQAIGSFHHTVAPPVFVQREMPSNAQEGGHFQLVYFPGPVEVDWNVGPASLATRPATSRMLFARREIPLTPFDAISAGEQRERLQHSTDFFWAMTPIAVKYAGRGATTAAVDQIDLLAGALTDTWWVLRESPNVFTKNPQFEPELTAMLPNLGPAIDPGMCLDAIVGAMTAMIGLKPDLEAAGVVWPSALVAQAEAITAIARKAIDGRGSESHLVARQQVGTRRPVMDGRLATPDTLEDDR